MNIIALSLGLLPVPPLPPGVRERQNRIADERIRCVNSGERMSRESATAFRARILDMLRDTGPGTTSDIALAFDTTCKGVRSHLYVLHDAGLVAYSEARHGARKDYTWYAVEAKA